MAKEPMTKHQHLARGENPYASEGGGGSTGGLRNNDAHVPQAGAGHVHETEPSKDAGHHHGGHDHSNMHEHHPGHHHGGHVHMHGHHPKEHDGGHGGHPHHGRKKNY